MNSHKNETSKKQSRSLGTRRNRVDAADNIGLEMAAAQSEAGLFLIKIEAVFYP